MCNYSYEPIYVGTQISKILMKLILCKYLNNNNYILRTYILTRSPSCRMTSGSFGIGEKWHMQLLTEIQVGNAIPFLSSFSFLKTLFVSSKISESPNSHISRTDLLGWHFSITCLSTPEN